MRFVGLMMCVFVGACASAERRSSNSLLPAPNPSGCYFYVFAEHDFGRRLAVVNGPYEDANTRRSWREPVRSIRVGETAVVTLYARPDFKGASTELPPNTTQPRFAQAEDVGSVRLSCR